MSEPIRPKKAVFYWASVAGADAEPVEVQKVGNDRVAFTIGCPDPLYLDRPDSCIELLPEYYGTGIAEDMLEKDGDIVPMDRPKTRKQSIAEERRARRQAARLKHHGWRGPR